MALPLLPPGEKIIQFDHEKAPLGNDGSFLVTHGPLSYTPADLETGVTYPIVTERSLPAVGNSHDLSGKIVADWNHAYHPREQLIRGSLVELGLRNCRVEWVHRDDHNTYHKQFIGPRIDTQPDLIKPILFSAAGFVPEKGLQYDGADEASLVLLSLEHRLHLWRSGRIRVANLIVVRDALLDRALQNDFNGINESTIDEFLSSSDPNRRFELGSTLLGVAVHDITNPLSTLYRTSRERQHLPPGAAKTVGKFAMRIISQSNRKRALRALDSRLRNAG